MTYNIFSINAVIGSSIRSEIFEFKIYLTLSQWMSDLRDGDLGPISKLGC